MSKIVQLAGGSRETEDEYTGPERELTVDTSNWDIRLHDGSTPGGHRIANLDNLVQLFQARSEELDGLLGFEPQNRGILVRRGPANYILRSLTVNAAQLVISNANGYSGNPLIGFADEITTPHSWSDLQTFDGGAAAPGGFVGDLVGDTTGFHTGNVLGNVEGDVLGDLTGDSAGTHTGPAVGSIDTRGATVQMDDGQIKLAWLEQDILDLIFNSGAIPGSIIAWGRPIDDIPSDWFICDGSNGTPDLRDKFIMGTDNDSDAGDTGGAATHSHVGSSASAGDHVHTFNISGTALTVNQIPSHRHLNGVVDKNDKLYNHGGAPAVPTLGDSIDGNSSSGTREGYTTYVGGGEEHTHPSSSTPPTGAHTHGVSVSTESSLPPYYKLVYIMKGGF